VLVVCLGTFYQSSILEAIFKKILTDKNIPGQTVWPAQERSGDAADSEGQSCTSERACPWVTFPDRLPENTWLHLIMYCLWRRAIRDLHWKSNQVKSCKARLQLLGNYDPPNNSLLKIPTMGTNLTRAGVPYALGLQGLSGEGPLGLAIPTTSQWLIHQICAQVWWDVFSSRPHLFFHWLNCVSA
jgi:low molecular weight phosphotyrosine protein phosphatase